MSVELQWSVPNTIVLATFEGATTAGEFRRAMEIFIGYLDAATHPIAAIIDWRAATATPLLSAILSRALEVILHRNLGWIVVVGPTPFLMAWINILSRLSPFLYRTVLTVEEALQFLQETNIGR
jgi:hypothetical protein